MKYLLLILPFMWGCAEKKVERTKIEESNLKCGDTVYNLYYQNFETGEAYRSEKAVVACNDSSALRQGISIDGALFPDPPAEWGAGVNFSEDTLPGGHSIHAEPYGKTRKTDQRAMLQAAFDKSYVKYVSPTFSTDSLIRDSGLYKTLADTLKNIQNPKRISSD